jgi:hypothetical protein
MNNRRLFAFVLALAIGASSAAWAGRKGEKGKGGHEGEETREQREERLHNAADEMAKDSLKSNAKEKTGFSPEELRALAKKIKEDASKKEGNDKTK